MSEKHRPLVAILASGGGTTAHALVRGIYEGRADVEIGLVIASKASAGILNLAQSWNSEWGFDTKREVIGNRTHPTGPRQRGQSQESSEAICRLLQAERIELVLQLGYMVIGNDPFVSEWGFVPGRDQSVYDSRALNWHPGILPLTADTYGDGAAQIMLEAYRRGEITEAGHSVHAVAHEIDGGPIYAAHPVEILPDDTKTTLFERIQWVEKTATPYVVDQFVRRQEAYRSGI